MGNNDKSGDRPATPANAAREAKLAKALRDNLKRRKASAARPPGGAAKADPGT